MSLIFEHRSNNLTHISIPSMCITATQFVLSSYGIISACSLVPITALPFVALYLLVIQLEDLFLSHQVAQTPSTNYLISVYGT